MKTIGAGLLAVAVLALGAPAASAQEVGQKAFELYAGYYVPGIDDLDNNISYGLRFGMRPADQLGWSLQAGYLDLSQNDDRPGAGRIGSADGYFVDASVIWYVAGSDFGVFGGIGFGTVDVDIVGTTTDVSDDAFTYNYGVHYVWNAGDGTVIKPEVRFRKWDGDTYEKTDEEYSISFGWRF